MTVLNLVGGLEDAELNKNIPVLTACEMTVLNLVGGLEDAELNNPTA